MLSSVDICVALLGVLAFALNIILFVIWMSPKNNLPNIIRQVAFRSEDLSKPVCLSVFSISTPEIEAYSEGRHLMPYISMIPLIILTSP